MKILVTGAGGFIGSTLTERLVEMGHEVRAFVRYNSRNHWGWLDVLPRVGNIEIVTGDVRDYDSVRAALDGVEAVFHLAALIGIPYSYVSPLAYVKTNVEGTYNVLQAARELGVKRVVHTSTSEVYGTAGYVPIDEDHPINPQSPYAATKASADYLALSYYRSFDLPVTVVRPFNTYGPRQSARAIIPTIIAQILSGAERIKLGNLAPTRDLNFVEDTVEGFISVGLAESTLGQTVNLSTGREISIGDLAGLIARLMDRKVEIAQDEQRMRPGKSEVERLLGDASKAASLTGWRSRVALEEGLVRTIDWIDSHRNIYKADLYNV